MSFLRVFRMTFVMEWKEMLSMDGIMFSFVSTLGTGIITAWILSHAIAGEARDHIYFGTPFLAIWVQGMSRTGLVLQREVWQGTLELMVPSRSSLFVVMASKAIAIATAGFPPALLILLIIYAVTGYVPGIASAGLFAVGCIVALVAVVATSLLFAPLIFIFAQKSAVLNAVWPVGAALGGFLYAPERLPGALEAVSRLLPTSWAIEALVGAARGTESGSALLLVWVIALFSVVGIVALTARLFVVAEHRVRTTGLLAR